MLLGLAALLFGAACNGIARPEGWAPVTARDETLFLTLKRGEFNAARLTDGTPTVLWTFPRKDERLPLVVERGRTLDAPKQQKINFEAYYGTPVITQDGIYLTAYSGHVIALTREGAARWVAQLPGRLIGGVLVLDGVIYVGIAEGDLYALRQDSGAVLWKRRPGGQLWSTPVPLGDGFVMATMDGRLALYDREGNERWNRDIARGGFAGTPLLRDDVLFTGSFDKRMYAVDARTGEVRWISEPVRNWFWTDILAQGDTLYAGDLGGAMHAFDVASGALRWSRQVGDMVRARAALVDGTLVVGTRDGRLHGLRATTGERLWAETSDSPADPGATRGRIYANLLAAGDRNGVFATTEGNEGRLYFLDLGQQKVSEISLR